jgi:hypothetical protein
MLCRVGLVKTAVSEAYRLHLQGRISELRRKLAVTYRPKIFGDWYKLQSSALCSLFLPPGTSRALVPFSQHPLSNSFDLSSLLNVRDQVLRAYKTGGKIHTLLTKTNKKTLCDFGPQEKYND